jgi:metal-responsive CopG/Arc/MetJ family transcriptional regulator
MGDAISVGLDRKLQRRLDRVCKRSGRSRSEIVRDALRRQLTLLEFEQARRQLMPFAETRGYLTDEDVYREIS